MVEYQMSIEIAASPETVFDYLTTGDGMTAWMGQHADLDPRPTGLFAVDIADFPIRGQYLHVERPTRVVVSWGVAGSEDLPVGASTVDFRLTATENGTRVDLVHSGLPETELAGHADGWEHFLPRLAVAAAGGDAGPDHWRPIGESKPPTTIKGSEYTMTRPSAYEIVQDYHRAWTSGNIDRAMTLVADDIVCRAPGGDLTGKDAYREFIGGFAPALTGLTDIAGFADGERVALFYYPQTAATATAPAAECFAIRDGKISESVLIFDRLSFSPPVDALTRNASMTQQADLIERLRALLAKEPSTREVSMFGGRSFMVNDKMVVSALKEGDLLVRVDAERHDELSRQRGATQAEMGAGRDMGPGWIAVSAASIASHEGLSFWLDVALDYNHAKTRRRT